MLFYSYAELIIGLVAIFYFTSKIFSITKYKLYFVLSLIFIISTASFACFIKSDQRYVILPVLHFVALTFLPISLGYNKKMMLIFSSLFFSRLTFFIYTIYQLLCSILHIKLTIQSSTVFELISNLIVLGIFVLLSSPLKIKTKLVVESITKPTIIMILIFLYIGGSMATFGAYYIIPSSDYRTATLKILTMIVSVVFSFSIPILLYNQIKKSQYMHENDIYERQLNAQINYYKSITTSGYELRKIRHDYNDLSIGLKSLINSRKYDEVLPLLQKYDSEIISSFQILYNTGNDLTDAILSDKQKNADENIKITFEGSLANVPADSLEICVLFNNMIDIAFENVKEFCGNGKQIIALKAETRAGFLFCCISFPIENEIKKAQNNVLYHSFAYKTLKNLAEKNGGKIETSLSDDRLAITTGWVVNNFS